MKRKKHIILILVFWCSVWSGWLSTSPISCSRAVRRASGSSSPQFFWPVLVQRCGGLSSAPPARQMWSSGAVWTSTTWCLSTLDTGNNQRVELLTLVELYWSVSHNKIYIMIYHLLRNTAVETVEQELLFVGTENGKLVAMRDIIKKVRTLQRVYFSSLKNEFCLI